MRCSLCWALCATLLAAAVGCTPNPLREEIVFGDAGAQNEPFNCDAAEPLDDMPPASSGLPSIAVFQNFDAGSAPDDSLCDGSADLRLVVSAVAFRSTVAEIRFLEPHGDFLALDGHCHFYVQPSASIGMYEGTLSRQQAQALAADLAIAHLADLVSTRTTCYDGAITMIATPQASVSCTCSDCGADAVATRALQYADAWLDQLPMMGEPLAGPVTALAQQGEPPAALMCYPRQQVLAWPLSTHVQDTPGLIGDARAPGVLIDNLADVAALRDVRAQSAQMLLAPTYHALDVYVRDQEIDYALFIRDELLAADEQALTAFLTAAWANEPPP
jgi:hypothetical protein